MLVVAEVSADDCGDATARHVITATDSSKTGTAIDGGSKLKGESKVLDGNRHIIQLGSWDKTFTLEWHPVVLSFKTSKAAPITAEREKLESTGIKLLGEYVGLTTHVVAKVRNTAAGLLGLVQARWLVTPEFVDAVAAACKRQVQDGDGEQRVSPLELDFDANWPKEEDYFIPTAGEPVKRPAEWLKPDSARSTVFDNFTFLLFSVKQRDSLSPVIQAGGGKALAYTFEKGVTTKDQVVDYVQNVAGEKGNSNFSLGHNEGPGGIVVVRAEAKDASRDNEFMASIDTALNQRSVEQNELLDVILENNASVLCRPLRLSTQTVAQTPVGQDRGEPTGSASYNNTRGGVDQAEVSQDAPPSQQDAAAVAQTQDNAADMMQRETTTPASSGMTALQKLKARRAIKQKELKNEFDASLVVRATSDSPEPSMRAPSEPPSTQNRDFDEPSQMRDDDRSQRRPDTQQGGRKRAAPAVDEPDETNEQMMDRLAPGAANYKRRKTQALRDGEASLAETKPKVKASEAENATTDKAKGKGKGKQVVKQENDLQAQMRAQREKEDEERRKDEESMREMRDVDVNTIKIDHNVEVFDLPVRPPREEATTATGEGRGERWNPAWDGRQNFKKFRPKRNRQGNGGANGEVESQRLVIPLEEIPGRGHGLGDEYWLEPVRDGARKKKKSQTQTQSQSQSRSQPQPARTSAAAAGDSDDDQISFRRRLQQSREDDAEAALADEFFEEAATSQSTLGRTQTSKAGGASAAAKRPATTQASGGPPAKKARQAPARQTAARPAASRAAAVIIDDSDEDDDPLAFKRR